MKTSRLRSNHAAQTPPPLRRFSLVIILGSLAMMGPLSIDMYLPALRQMLRLTSWHGIFIILSCVGFLMFLTVLTSLRETLAIENRSSGGITQTFAKFRDLFGDREFMGYALSQGFVTASLFAYISGSSFVLQSIYGVSPQTYSLIFAVNGLGFVIASQVTGRLVSRINEWKLLVSGFVMVSIGGVSLLIVLLMGTGLPWVLPPFFLIVASMGIVGPTTTSLALQKQGKSAGSAAALLGVLSLMFGAFSSPLVGIGGGQAALPLGMVIAVTSVSSILCYMLFIRSKNAGSGKGSVESCQFPGK